jgi:hypothetical protein
MNPRIWLRAAAVITLIHTVLHTIGGVFSSPDPGAQTVAVTAMKVNTFMAFGNLRSYWMFYRGMGLAVTLFLTLSAVVFWLFGDLIKVAGPSLRPVLIACAAAYLAFAVISSQYFFLLPVITELLIAACLIIATIGLKKPRPCLKHDSQPENRLN